MEYTILLEQMALQEYVSGDRLTEPLLDGACLSKMYLVSEFDIESCKKW